MPRADRTGGLNQSQRYRASRQANGMKLRLLTRTQRAAPLYRLSRPPEQTLAFAKPPK